MGISEDHGVDHVVAVGGSGTLQRSIEETRMTNTIRVIGTKISRSRMRDALDAKTISHPRNYAGNRNIFEDINSAIA
jgi:hypothetical protein